MAKTLLLADDSVTIQKVVGISFASEDIQIETVDNGDDAVARARELRPDIILADVVMPGLSGYEVCEAMKADASLAQIPVVLLTGTFEAFDEERAEAAGAAGHVSKPFEAQTLVDRVKELIEASPVAAAPVESVAPAAAASVDSVAPAAAPPQAFDFSDDGDFAGAPASSRETAPEALDFDDSDSAFSFEEDEMASAVASPAELPPPVPAPDATQLMPPVPAPEEAPVEPSDVAQSTLLDPVGATGFDVSSSDLRPPSMSPDPVLAKLSGRSPAPAPVEPPAAASDSAPGEDSARNWDSASSEDSARSGDSAASEDSARNWDSASSEGSGSNWDSASSEGSGSNWDSASSGSSASDSGAGDTPRPWGAMPERPVWPAEPSAASVEVAPVEAAPIPVAPPLPGSVPAPVAAQDVEPGANTAPFLDEVEPLAPAAYGAEAPAGSAPFQPELADEPAPEIAVPVAADPASALTPELRHELSDTLEKIAWDAFGPVTEKIVAQALERIEQVVWEVVPQIAQTLIQEEIRRLKEGGDGE